MKKLMSIAMLAAFTLPVFAQESAPAQETPASERQQSAMWPAFAAIGDFPASPDVIGIRLTIPFSTRQENVTGIDLGLWGRSMYFEGIQVNILRSDVKDGCSGVQVGCYNSIGSGELIGAQVGLWNEAGSFRGGQAGLVNLAGSGEGVQIGLINRAETLYGFQIGLVNVIREAEIQFCPIVNVGF